MSPRSFSTLLLLAVGMAACSVTEVPTETWWVNSFKVDCVGVGPMQCLQVHDGDAPMGEWRNIYQPITGFDHVPGNLYRIRVRVTELPRDRVPADASSLRYELVEIVDTVPDPRAPLHDIFVLEAIGTQGAERGGTGVAQATIEFNIVRERYSGYDGCVDFEGPIQVLDGERLELGHATLNEDDDCPQTSGASNLLAALNSVVAWRRDGLKLELLDDTGTRRLLLGKVD